MRPDLLHLALILLAVGLAIGLAGAVLRLVAYWFGQGGV